MCRLYGFRANAPTKVECTLAYAQNALMVQSRRDQGGRAHSDGWGIAYYENGEPRVERRDTAAHRDLHFSLTAERIRAETVVAHVRKATIGHPAAENTQPFSFGRWTFAHNGTIRGFAELESELESEVRVELRPLRRGATDSELAFYWLLTRLSEGGVELERGTPCVNRVAAALASGVDELANRCRAVEAEREERLNFLLTDGRIMVVSRWNNGLYWVKREGVHDCEICGIHHVHHRAQVDYRAVIVASEPLTHEDWHEVPNGDLLTIDEGIRARVETR